MKEKVANVLGLVDQNAEDVERYITDVYIGGMTENSMMRFIIPLPWF